MSLIEHEHSNIKQQQMNMMWTAAATNKPWRCFKIFAKIILSWERRERVNKKTYRKSYKIHGCESIYMYVYKKQ